jgi:hypothetical protein
VYLSDWAITAGSGALLLVAAVCWRLGHRARMRGRIAAALGDEDPQRRRAGVLVATEQGLRANATLLAAHLDREQHPAVLAALVDGVLRHSWEPTDQPSILALRLWAHQQRRPPAPVAEPLDAAVLPMAVGGAAPGSSTGSADERTRRLRVVTPAVPRADPYADPVTERLPLSAPPAVRRAAAPRRARHRAGTS